MDKAGFDTSFGEPDRKEFGPYTLVRRLGVGGMAETYEAIRKGPGDFTQRVCLKLVLPFFRDREDFLTLFKREARLAAKLRHSNVVGVIDFGETDGVTYIALELVDGADLATLLDAQPGTRIPPEHAALVGHDIAAALEHAHDPRRDGSADGPSDNAIIHRDLSPSNVLVSQRGEILLTDFGVAKAITGTARQQSAVKGKVPYMSPEQLRSEPLDGRADLFALGVVLYESLAGHRPFQGEHDPGTIMQILNGDRRPLLEVAPETLPGFAEVVEQLLEPDRDARPESASALLEMLDPYVPSPRERRELGKAVSVVRASMPAPSPLNPVSGSGPTEASGEPNREASGVARTSSSLPGSVAAPTPPSPAFEAKPRPPSRPVWLVGVLLLGIAAVFGLWANRAGRAPAPATSPVLEEAVTPAADEVPTTTPEPPPTPAADTALGEESPAEPAAAVPEAAEPATRDPKPGRLSVAVFPWGDVWIDGKHRGKAPILKLPLPPGRHKVSVGQGEASKTRVVRLKPGQRRSIQFDLSK
jgi:serine/threonine-protein kinase